jgi:hypothetical protein
VITNREITDEALLREALDEIVESARENGVREARLAAALREHADAVEAPGESAE